MSEDQDYVWEMTLQELGIIVHAVHRAAHNAVEELMGDKGPSLREYEQVLDRLNGLVDAAIVRKLGGE